MVRRWGEFFFWGGGRRKGVAATFGPEGLYFGMNKIKFYTQNFFSKKLSHVFVGFGKKKNKGKKKSEKKWQIEEKWWNKRKKDNKEKNDRKQGKEKDRQFFFSKNKD